MNRDICMRMEMSSVLAIHTVVDAIQGPENEMH